MNWQTVEKLYQWFFSLSNWQKVLATVFQVVITLILAKLTIKIGSILIDRLFNQESGRKFISENRAQTLATLLKSLLRYVVYFGACIIIIDIFVPRAAGTILTGAGVVGLAVGFGAQNLVKDVITGFFILFEDQFAVGDYINIAGVSGIVEDIGLRVTRLRDFGGQFHIVPNGSITQVTNLSRGSMQAVVEVGIAYEEDVDRAIRVLSEIGQEAARDLSEIIVEGPDVLGIVAFGQSEVLLRMVAKTVAMQQWRVERELRRRIKEAFDRENIEIPYPKQVMIRVGDEPDEQISDR